MATPLRVLFLMEDLCFGGTQRQTLELARRLDRSRFAPLMLTLTGPTDLDAVAREADIELHHLGAGRRVPAMFFVQLPAYLHRLRPHVLVPCTALPNIWGRIWGRVLRAFSKTGMPAIVGTCRGGGGPVRQHERLFWRWTDHMICNSQALESVLQDLGVPPERLSCISNGVDTAFYAPGRRPSSRTPLLLCVARLAKDKDHMTLLRAMEFVLRRHPDARLRLVGDGPEEGRLRHWAETHAVGNCVDFVPGGLDMREHYAAARIFVLASLREGQPNVLLEAMSCGLPVCATTVGGIPGLVSNGEHGLLSPAGDAAALADNCCRLLEDDALCDDLGRNGRSLVEGQFSFAAMVQAHEEIFSKVGALVRWS